MQRQNHIFAAIRLKSSHRSANTWLIVGHTSPPAAAEIADAYLSDAAGAVEYLVEIGVERNVEPRVIGGIFEGSFSLVSQCNIWKLEHSKWKPVCVVAKEESDIVKSLRLFLVVRHGNPVEGPNGKDSILIVWSDSPVVAGSLSDPLFGDGSEVVTPYANSISEVGEAPSSARSPSVLFGPLSGVANCSAAIVWGRDRQSDPWKKCEY